MQINGATVVTTLTISVVWIVYSMIPPYLLIHYTWIGRGTTLQFMCRVAFVLSFATSIAAMLLLWAVYPKDYDFGASTKVRAVLPQFFFLILSPVAASLCTPICERQVAVCDSMCTLA